MIWNIVVLYLAVSALFATFCTVVLYQNAVTLYGSESVPLWKVVRLWLRVFLLGIPMAIKYQITRLRKGAENE